MQIWSKKYLVDSTSIIAASTPIIYGLQTVFAGVSDEVSLRERVLTAGLTYFGLGKLFSELRDKSRSQFAVKGRSELVQYFHDSTVNALFMAVISPPLLAASCEQDLETIVAATAIRTAYGFLAGGPIGYAIDLGRDLTGLKRFDRFAAVLRNRSPRVKKGIAALLLGTSVATTTALYHFPNNVFGINSSIPESTQY